MDRTALREAGARGAPLRATPVEPGTRLVAVLSGGLSLGLAALFLAVMLLSTGGRLVAPLDDAYIYFQYARGLAEGRLFAYQGGDGYSTGATSFLYPWLLALGYRVGLQGSLLVLWGMLLGAVSLWLSSVLLYVLVRRWLGGTAALLSAALFLASGWMLWAAFSMLETGLYTALLLGVILAWDVSRVSGRYLAFGAAAALLPLMRPEGMFLAPLLVMLALADRGLQRGVGGLRDRALLPLAGPFLAMAAYLGVVAALTGTTATNGLVSKSVLYAPGLNMVDRAGYMAESFLSFFAQPYGSAVYVPPLMLLPFLVGAAAGAYGDAADRRIGVGFVMLTVFLGGLLAASHNGNYAMHWYRYLAPYQPMFIALSVAGLLYAAELMRVPASAVLRAGGAYLLLLMLVTAVVFIGRYGGAVADIREQHVRTAEWLRGRVPEGQTIAINDAGVIPYVSERPVYDLLGLVTNGAAAATRQGPGSVIERLERLPEARRPAYFAVYDEFFYGWFRDLPMLDEIQRFHLERKTIAGADDMVVYRVDRSAYGSGDDMAGDHGRNDGWRVVDAVDVADIEDEASHDYRLRDTGQGRRPSVVRQLEDAAGDRVLDGGRETAGGEAFSAAVTSGRPLRLVMRTDAPVPASLDVFVDGEYVGYLQYRKARGWIEPEFEIPARFVRSDRVRIELRFSRGDYSDRYTSFHYWLLQPGPA